MYDPQLITAHLAMLFSDESGYVATARGENGYFTRNGKYKFERWSEQQWRWPDQRDQLIAEIVQDLCAGQRADWYQCPALRSGKTREVSDRGARSQYAWADLDGAALPPWALELGAAVINSGSSGHFHLYIPLGRWISGTEVAALNQDLVRAIGSGADAKWQHNSLLRIAGTPNFKSSAEVKQ